jgi:hypothetical protein
MRFILLNSSDVVARTFVVQFHMDRFGFANQACAYYKYVPSALGSGFSGEPSRKRGSPLDKRSLSLRINPENHARKFPGVRSIGQY